MPITTLARWDHPGAAWVPLQIGRADPPPPPPPPGGLRPMSIAGSRTSLSDPDPGSSTLVRETSGLLVYRGGGTATDRIFLAVNDSDPTAAYLLAFKTGKVLARYQLGSVSPFDQLEDMSYGPGPVAGTRYVYVGQIGESASAKKIYRVVEPSGITLGQSYATPTISTVDVFTIASVPWTNSEAMVVDVNGDLLVWGKSSNKKVTVWKAPAAQFVAGGGALTFTSLGSVWANVAGGIGPTAADLSRNGRRLAWSNYKETFWADIPEGETAASVIEALAAAGGEPYGYVEHSFSGLHEAAAFAGPDDDTSDPVQVYRLAEGTTSALIVSDVTYAADPGDPDPPADPGLGALAFQPECRLGSHLYVNQAGVNKRAGPRIGANVEGVVIPSLTIAGVTHSNVPALRCWTRSFEAAGHPDGMTIAGRDFEAGMAASGMWHFTQCDLAYGDWVWWQRTAFASAGQTVARNTRQVTITWAADGTWKEMDIIERGYAKADLLSGAASNNHHAGGTMHTGDHVEWPGSLLTWSEWRYHNEPARASVWRDGVKLAEWVAPHVIDVAQWFGHQTAVERGDPTQPDYDPYADAFYVDVANVRIYNLPA